MKKFLFLFLVLGIVSCKSNQDSPKNTEKTEIADELFDAVPEQKTRDVRDEIKKRIEEIWSNVPGNMEELDQQFCSQSYKDAYDYADKYCQENGFILLDGDHYINGQDIDEEGLEYTIADVQMDSETAATVQIVVKNYRSSNVVVKLVYENENWFIDDFINRGISEKEILLDYQKN